MSSETKPNTTQESGTRTCNNPACQCGEKCRCGPTCKCGTDTGFSISEPQRKENKKPSFNKVAGTEAK